MRYPIRRPQLAAFAIGLTVITAACGHHREAQPARKAQPAAHMSFSLIGVNRLVNLADGGAVVHVDSVSGAKWNSNDGKPWTEDRTAANPVTPLQYRDATVSVVRVIFASASVPLQAGSALTIRLYGSGAPTGAVIDGVSPTLHFDEVSGPVAVGEDHLVILARAKFATQSGEVDCTRLVNHFQGNWTIKDSRAVSVVAGRSVDPADRLIARLSQERSRGRATETPAAEDQTRINPVG